jgi:DNA-binding CsgD family transcriptional regulator/tetratricopeptide (TPR) repeat protein
VRSSSFHEPTASLVLADPNVPAAFTAAIELGESELAVRIAAALATRALQTGILREAIGRLRVAVELPGVSDGVRSDGWNAFVSVRGEMRELDGLAADAERALAYARASGTPERIVRTLITVGNWTDGDRIPFYAEAGALADEIDYAWGGAVAWETLSGAYWMAGRSEDAMRAAIRAHEASERHGDRAGFATRLASRGEFELNLGRIEAGIEHLGQAWAIFGTHPGQPSVMTWALAMLAAGLALAGRLAEAYQTLAEAARLTARAESDLGAQDWLEAAAIVLQFEHPVAAARCLGLVDRIASDVTMGRVSARLDAAAARRVEGRIGRRRLEAERAAGRSMVPRALFTPVARLVRTAAGPAMPDIRAPFGALTAREVEILGLLGEGHTDRSIAARLGISPKTASVHVANLKGKLGVETRVEAVLYARERLDGLGAAAGEGTGD